jgi:hypothetical protein
MPRQAAVATIGTATATMALAFEQFIEYQRQSLWPSEQINATHVRTMVKQMCLDKRCTPLRIEAFLEIAKETASLADLVAKPKKKSCGRASGPAARTCCGCSPSRA